MKLLLVALQATAGAASWARPTFFSILSLTIIGYGIDRLIIRFSV